MVNFLKNFINYIYGFILDRRTLDQFIPVQVINRTQEEYDLSYYGEHEFFESQDVQKELSTQLPRLALALTPQALSRPYYYNLRSAGVYRMDVVDPQNPSRILLENFPDVSNPFENQNFPISPWNKFHITRRMKNQSYDIENAFLFAGRWWGNYYHFVIDYCIRFNSLREEGIIDDHTKILFPGPIKKWQSEYLCFLGIDPDKIILTNENPIFVKNILVASTRRERFLLSKIACVNFKQTMLRATGSEINCSRKKRIYISRQNSSRRILNENELIHMLKTHDFQIVQCENLTVFEQISLFSQAEIIIAPHGAGLTNLIYSERPMVIEIVPHDAWVWGYFAMLTCRLGGKYHAVPGKENNENIDFVVDIGAISDILNRYCDSLKLAP